VETYWESNSVKPDNQKLCSTLGYEFKDKKFFDEALTHRSAKGGSNERLEFLGDSVLNFVIASYIYENNKESTEGQLSRLRASLVRGETLAEMALEFELGKYLHLGPGELKSGGAHRKSILADAMEAIIGAIYLDGGIGVCEKNILNWFKERLESAAASDELKDPKTRLQEFLQSKKYPLPQYNVKATEGSAHEQTFHVECTVEGLSSVTSGSGSSRRKAEQEAAEKFLPLIENEVSK